MTPDEFRDIALELPGAEERSHMGHPDFRVKGKIFASLGYPDESFAMAALTPAEQQDLIRVDRSFSPVNGKWGERGATSIALAKADEANVREALTLAWKKRAG